MRSHPKVLILVCTKWVSFIFCSTAVLVTTQRENCVRLKRDSVGGIMYHRLKSIGQDTKEALLQRKLDHHLITHLALKMVIIMLFICFHNTAITVTSFSQGITSSLNHPLQLDRVTVLFFKDQLFSLVGQCVASVSGTTCMVKQLAHWQSLCNPSMVAK